MNPYQSPQPDEHLAKQSLWWLVPYVVGGIVVGAEAAIIITQVLHLLGVL